MAGHLSVLTRAQKIKKMDALEEQNKKLTAELSQLKEQMARSMVLPVTSEVTVEALTSAVLALADIQPELLQLALYGDDIATVAGIARGVDATGAQVTANRGLR